MWKHWFGSVWRDQRIVLSDLYALSFMYIIQINMRVVRKSRVEHRKCCSVCGYKNGVTLNFNCDKSHELFELKMNEIYSTTRIFILLFFLQSRLFFVFPRPSPPTEVLSFLSTFSLLPFYPLSFLFFSSVSLFILLFSLLSFLPSPARLYKSSCSMFTIYPEQLEMNVSICTILVLCCAAVC